MVILLLLLALVNAAFASTTTTIPYTTITPSIFNLPGTTPAEYKETMTTTLLLGAIAFLFFNVIRYYLAIAFSDEAGVARAKAEIYDNIAVALLIIGIWVLLQITEYVAGLAYPEYFSSGPQGFFDGYVLPQILSLIHI